MTIWRSASREDFDNDFGTGIEGSVEVVYGSADGLDPDTSELWHQSKPGILGSAEPTDLFSRALTAGDFNGDTHDDLAVGSEEDIVTDEGPEAGKNAGAVNVIFGSPTGLTAAHDQIWHQNSAGMPDEAELNDDFGVALTAGDVGGGIEDDLIIGVPQEELSPAANAGAVHVLFGSATGPTSVSTQFWTQDSPDILDQSETNDFFGATLTVGALDMNAPLDLVVGAQGESFEEVVAAGAINVIYGEVTGPSSTGNQFWHQDSPGIQSRAEDDDQFSQSQAYEYE